MATTELKDFVVAIELGSAKITGIAAQKQPDGSISVLAMVKEPSAQCIRKGMVYNIDKTAQCIQSIVKKLESQLMTRITQVFVGVGGQSVRSVRNYIVRDLAPETIIDQKIVTEMLDEDWAVVYENQTILEVVEQEYRVGTQLPIDPIGIPTNRIEGRYLNILQRASFFQNLSKCFEQANIEIADIQPAPIALANAVLTEAEKRSGCALVDIGADTTTVSVYSKNMLRHLAVIPLGSNNVSKDLEALSIDDVQAEKMKLKYASAFTGNEETDSDLKYPIGPDRQVESEVFNEIVEARMEEIIRNVQFQISSDLVENKLHGGIIITGGGSAMKNIKEAFANYTKVDKIRVAQNVQFAVNSSIDAIKHPDGTLCTVLGLLYKCNVNCAGKAINPNGDLFDNEDEEGDKRQKPERKSRTIEEEARRKKEEEERLQAEAAAAEAAAAAAAEAEAAAAAAAAAAEERKKNSFMNKFKNKLTKFKETFYTATE